MIRTGDINDFSIIKNIEKRVFYELAYSDDEIIFMLTRENSYSFIFEDPEPSGYVTFFIEDDAAHIESIAVLPSKKGKGIGKALMKAVEEFSIKKKLKRIVLEVRVRNRRAIEFYKSLGFEIKYRIENYYTIPYRGSRDAYFMEKLLGPEPPEP